ncbi:MAG: hypothetical protein Q9159_000417 [Coniocarpon cinnabarinum]
MEPASVVSDHDLIPADLLVAVDKHQHCREYSQQITTDVHLPAMKTALETQRDGEDPTSTIVMLGDESLSNASPVLEKALQKTITARHVPKVLDLTVSEDTIANVLYRLRIGLFDALSGLFSGTDNCSNLIILSVGAHDTLETWNKQRETAFQRGSISAFRTLLDLLLRINNRVSLVVIGRTPRAGVQMNLVQKATFELFEAADIKANTRQSRVLCFESPLAIQMSHLDTDVQLGKEGCSILVLALQPHLAPLLDQSHRVALNLQGDERSSGLSMGEHCSLRPAQDVLNRILHDADRFDAEKVVVGYLDRHEGTQEIFASAWLRDSTDEDFIPMHRIRYFRTVGPPAQVLWDRQKRVDNIFKS